MNEYLSFAILVFMSSMLFAFWAIDQIVKLKKDAILNSGRIDKLIQELDHQGFVRSFQSFDDRLVFDSINKKSIICKIQCVYDYLGVEEKEIVAIPPYTKLVGNKNTRKRRVP